MKQFSKDKNIPIRSFTADETKNASGLNGPKAIADDIDSIIAMFNPDAKIPVMNEAGEEQNVPGGISEKNLQNGAVSYEKLTEALRILIDGKLSKQHIEASELDHADGSVTKNKLAPDVLELIGSGGFHVGPEKPTDPNLKFWLDTDEEWDGVSPTVVLEETDDGVVLCVTNAEGDICRAVVNHGKPGRDGNTPQRGIDYWTAADKEEVLSDNKTYIADELTKRNQLKPEFANSIDELKTNGDTSKLYVLPDGFIYAYMTKTEIVEHKSANKFVASEAAINTRMGSSSPSTQNGFVWTGAIPVDLTKESPFEIKVEGTKITEDTSEYQKLWLCADNTGSTKLSAAVLVAGKQGASGNSFGTLLKDGTIYADYKEGSKVSDSIISQTKFLRIGFKFSDSVIGSVSELSGVSITFPHETYTEKASTTGWMSTGKAFIPADYEDKIVSLEEKAATHDLAIYNIKENIADLSSGGNAITIPTFWESAVDECIAKIKAMQAGRHCVTFPFFSDNHQRNGYAGALIKKVMDACHIPYCFYGGDSISSGYIANEDVMIAQDNLFDTMMSVIPKDRFCRAVGNHDGFWNVSEATGDEYRYTRAQVYELFLREESVAQSKHFGDDGTYYYVDDIASKTRFVVLNSNQLDGISFDSTQAAWVENVVLNFSESGWGVVFFSHAPITNNFHSNITNAQAIQGVLVDYINGTDENKADVIGWFAGHIHRDRIYWTDHTGNTEADDQETKNLPFPTITITSDNTGIAYDDSTKHTVGEDDLSHAIDFVTINKIERTINLTRLGIGNDREVNY